MQLLPCFLPSPPVVVCSASTAVGRAACWLLRRQQWVPVGCIQVGEGGWGGHWGAGAGPSLWHWSARAHTRLWSSSSGGSERAWPWPGWGLRGTRQGLAGLGSIRCVRREAPGSLVTAGMAQDQPFPRFCCPRASVASREAARPDTQQAQGDAGSWLGVPSSGDSFAGWHRVLAVSCGQQLKG